MQVRVVIIGQDPYHGPGQACGLSFSVPPGVRLPSSLLNIFKELRDDVGCPVIRNGDLSSWADQGVLLLNAVSASYVDARLVERHCHNTTQLKAH